MTDQSRPCVVCGSAEPPVLHTAREMMYGTRELFEYHECVACGSLQIAEVPPVEVLARHYPEDYYSFAPARASGLRAFAMKQRNRALLGLPSLGGSVLARRRPHPTLSLLLRDVGLTRDLRILDVGCGAGELLDQLAGLGFRHLQGIDPFGKPDFVTPGGVAIRKRYLSEVTETFDVVMFHHSLEHVPDPAADLATAAALLAPGGRCLVRMPTPSSEAWDRYGTDWVQLDAPRHLVLVTREGVEIMGSAAGLELEQTIDDATEMQFRISDAYRRDVPMMEAPGPWDIPVETQQEYADLTARLNAAHRGDQALWVLVKPQ